MSLLKKIGKVFKPIAKALKPVAGLALTAFGGPVGAIAGGLLAASSKPKGAGPPALPSLPEMAMSLTGYTQAAGALPAITGAATRVVPGAGRAAGGIIRGATGAYEVGKAAGRLVKTPVGYLKKYGKKAGEAAGWITIGGYWLDQAGNVVGKRSTRRLNPLNARALRRAITRVKSAKRICNEVERITAPRRRAPSRSCPPKRC